MKAFIESGRAFTRPAGLILLFGGEVGPRRQLPAEDPDEHSGTDILTSGLEPHSRLPGFINQWLLHELAA